MTTPYPPVPDAVYDWWQAQCLTRQPRVEPGFPGGCSVATALPETVFDDMAMNPTSGDAVPAE